MKKQQNVADGAPVRPHEPIALVGMACRFPGGVNNLHDYWNLLTRGNDGITEVPETRWPNRRFYDPETSKAGKIKCPKGGFVDGFDQFDAGFFDLFPAVASRIDPQQRFLLETTYEAMEDAGISLEKLSGSDAAVYMGVFMNDYWDMQACSVQRDQISAHTAMGASRTSVANRISYLYNLKGPSLTVDTACSSSLVAVHMACQSIWSGESSLAIAGGVNIMIRPETSMMLSKGNFLSPDGYCKSFDSRANGYVRSEGCGVILLKPLAQAEADGDLIHAVIRGSAVNQDGYTEAGFTVPSLTSQVEMLKTAYRSAGVDPTKVAYVEAHGTGTPVGDPIETNAFGEVIGKGRPADWKCWIGSVKSNIGHTEAAAGVAGLIKLALVLKHQQIPQNLHFENPNPNIPFDTYRLRVPTQLEKLPRDGAPAIGGVNSFGAGGTNAHVVLEEYVPSHPTPTLTGDASEDQVHLFVLSAKSQTALQANAKQYVTFLQTTEAGLAEICYSAATRRSTLTHRLAIAARTKQELTEKLEAYLQDETRPGLTYHSYKPGSAPKVGFIFSGQGPQWFAMGQQLIQSSPVFREVILKIDRLFLHVADWSLLEEMSKDEASSRISDTRIAQPAIMAVQIGLTELWKSWGVVPQGCVGHSIGEVAAAYATGALTLKQAVEVIYHRSRGQNRATGKGKMLAAALTLAEAQQAIQSIEDSVSIAAINGPNMMTFSGDAEPLERLADALDKQDVFHRFLRVNVPFHSHHMEPLKDELIDSLTHLVPGAARIALYSTVSGQQEDGTHLDSAYWYRNVREPVYFTDALQQMIDDGFDTFIEVAPHPVLTAGATALLEKNAVKQALIVPSLCRKEKDRHLDEAATMIGSLGMLFAHGYPVDWLMLFGRQLPYVKLPAYVWQHQRYWFEAKAHAQQRLAQAIHPHISTLTTSATQHHMVASLSLDTEAHPYLQDHKVEGTTIFPGTGHLEIAEAVSRAFYPNKHHALRDIHFSQAVFIPESAGGHAEEVPGSEWEVRLEISEDPTGSATYSLVSRAASDNTWARHSWGTIQVESQAASGTNLRLADVRQRVAHPVSVSDYYLELKESGLQYGEAFRNIRKLWINQDQQELLAQLKLPARYQYESGQFNLHPALLDACLHAIEYAGKWTNAEEKSGIYLPTYIKEYRQYGSPGDKVYCHIQVVEAEATHLHGEYAIFNEDGTLIAEIKGLECRYIDGSRGEEPLRTYEGMYEYQWQAITEAQALVDASPVKRVNGDATGGCVLFADNQGTVARLREYFRGDHLYPILIEKGQAFKEMDATHYVVRAESQGDITEALQRVLAHGYRISRVLYAWGLDQPNNSRLSAEVLLASQQSLAHITLNALRSLVELSTLPEVCILTQGCEKVVNTDSSINIHQAALYGMGRVTKNEYPGVALTLVDLSARAEAHELQHLYDYFTRLDRQQWSHLALRGARRYRLQLMPVEDPNTGSAGRSSLPTGAARTLLTLSPDATYLVTGGASGFGLMLGQWLGERGAKHLALLSRSGTKYTADEQIIGQMRAAGIEVQLFSVDITDADALAQTIAQIHATMPPLQGVIHSAAVLHDTTLPNTTPEAYDKVFKPKALGAWNLHVLTQALPLDFFLTLSSVSAVFGLPGQASYSSANNFLDKLAAYKQSLGQKASSINLGVLGLYAGMSKEGGNVMKVLENQGWIPLQLEDVLDKIENVLVHQPAQRMAAGMDWQRFGAFFPHLEDDERFALLIQKAKEGGDAAGHESLLHQILSQEGAKRAEVMVEKLAIALSRILGTTAEEMDTATPITQLGLDSLMLSQLRNWIQQKLEVNYPLMRIAKGPSLNELAEQLLEQLHPADEKPAAERPTATDTSGVTSEADIETIANQWLVRRKRGERSPEVLRRIFCIHPVGAGASMFSHFIYHAPEDTEVMAFQLPGRENRSGEPPYEDMDQLIADMAQAVQPYLDKPFMVIGHSFGGVIGYELLRHLHRTLRAKPQHLTVTGTIAPQLTKGWKRTEAISKTAQRSYSEEKIIGILNYIDDVDFLRSILPVMRGDMPLIMSYKYQPLAPVDFPITAFAASQDEVVTIEQVGAWKEQTSEAFSLEVVEGDHWFLSRNKELILQRLNEAWAVASSVPM